jgi:hypothetical protein
MSCNVMSMLSEESMFFTSGEAAAGGSVDADAVAEDHSMDQRPFNTNLSLML